MQSQREGYHGGTSAGGKLGCGIAALVGVPLLGVATIIASMGQCDPDASCPPNWLWFAGAVIVASAAGFGSRAALNALLKRLRKDR